MRHTVSKKCPSCLLNTHLHL